MNKTLQNRLSTTGYTRNSLVAVNSLPTEILLEVFAQALAVEPIENYYCKGLRRLSLVCAQWNTVVENASDLWSVISYQLPSSSVKRALVKSRNWPLRIRTTASATRQFYDLLAPHASRWKTADLTVQSTATLEPLTNTNPAIRLESLKLVSSGYGSYNLRTINIFGGNAPRLQDVTLRGIPIPWDSGLLSGLRSLEISRLGVRDGPSLVQMLDMLSASPSLQDLVLQDASWSGEEELPEERDVILLDNLSKVHLKMNGKQGDALWDWLDFTVNQSTDVSLTFDLPSSELYPPTSLDDAIPLVIFHAGKGSKFSVRLDERRFRCSSGSVSVDVEYAEPATDLVQWLHSMLQPVSPTPEIELTLEPSLDITDHPVQAVMDNLWYATRLVVHRRMRNLPTLIWYLSRPRKGASGSRDWWPLDRLRELVFHGGRINSLGLVEMVRSRYGQSEQCKEAQAVAGLGDLPLPVRFSCIDIRELESWHQDAQEQLVALMNDGVVKREDIAYVDEDLETYRRERNARRRM